MTALETLAETVKRNRTNGGDRKPNIVNDYRRQCADFAARTKWPRHCACRERQMTTTLFIRTRRPLPFPRLIARRIGSIFIGGLHP